MRTGAVTARAAARRERPADVLGGLTDDLDELRQGEPEEVVVPGRTTACPVL